MIKNLKTGFKLLKYSYKCKINLILLAFFTVIGLVSEISSHGTNMLGGFYFTMSGMFAYQMIVSMDISGMVQSSAMKKRLQISMPVFVSTVIYIILYTVLVIERIILVHVNPQDKDMLMFTLFTIVMMLFIMFIFSAICYKYFVAGFIIFFALLIGTVLVLDEVCMRGGYEFICNMGFGTFIIIGYAVILAGGAIEYLIGKLLYRKPLSEFAFRGIFKDAK